MILAHGIVGKKEDEDIERQYNSLIKCTVVRYTVWFVLIKHIAENLDKWIQVATIDNIISLLFLISLHIS